jgi:hypothetical protein
MNSITSTIPLIIVSLALSGCALFTSPYDVTRHENFTKLKAVHMKFFDDWTVGTDKTWNLESVTSYCDKGDLQYREAIEYARSTDKSDSTGERAVKILWESFTSNCALSLKKEKLFSKVFMQELRPEIEKNYNYAIAGELARVTKN